MRKKLIGQYIFTTILLFFRRRKLIGQYKRVHIDNRVIIKNMSDALLKIIPNFSNISSTNHISKNKFS
jgi:hypothetical protein